MLSANSTQLFKDTFDFINMSKRVRNNNKFKHFQTVKDSTINVQIDIDCFKSCHLTVIIST